MAALYRELRFNAPSMPRRVSSSPPPHEFSGLAEGIFLDVVVIRRTIFPAV